MFVKRSANDFAARPAAGTSTAEYGRNWGQSWFVE